MKSPSMRRFGAAVAFGLVLCAAGLAAADDQAKDGPKDRPHHGARMKSPDGTLVVFDGVFGTWFVPDRKQTYWIDGRYWQYSAGLWTVSSSLAGPWQLAAERVVPEAARERFEVPRTAVTATLPTGREAVFDPRLRAYKVVGRKGVFVSDGEFYRYDNGLWLASSGEDGPWTLAPEKELPVPLRKGVPEPEPGQKVTLPSGGTATWDAKARLFVVEGRDTVLFDGRYWERREDLWFSSPQPTEGFAEVALESVPGPVRARLRKPPLVGDKPKPAKAPGAAGQKPKPGPSEKPGAAKGAAGEAAKKKSADPAGK